MCGKPMRGRQKALFCRWGVVGYARKSYLGPAEIASFSICGFSQSNKHNTFCIVVLTGYFYVLFLWAVAVSALRPLEIYKKVDLSLPPVTLTVNSHWDNHFYKYIHLLQMLYNMKLVFFIKMHLKVSQIQIWFKCETQPLFFLTKTMVYRKKICIKNNFL